MLADGIKSSRRYFGLLLPDRAADCSCPARRLWLVMILAVMAAMAATMIGLYASFTADLPTNQTICVAACVILALALPVWIVRFVVRFLRA